MVLISSGIEKVIALELPDGIWADGVSVAAARTALVKWRSCWEDKFYQVYVNGQFAGVTVDSEQRQMIVQVPTSLERPVRIEVFAVEAGDADSDLSEEIESSDCHSGRVRIRLLRSQDLPIGSTVLIYYDIGTGQIDYDNPLNDFPIRVWPSRHDKAGFGQSRFGASDFGYDADGAVGFGKGVFAQGQFGFDADTIDWVSHLLEKGVYKFAVKVRDEAGNESSNSETGEVTVIPAAKPAEEVSVYSFDKQTNQLVLSVP